MQHHTVHWGDFAEVEQLEKIRCLCVRADQAIERFLRHTLDEIEKNKEIR